MIDFELDLWQQSPAHETLLSFYLDQDRTLRELRPEYDGWFGRIEEHPQIPREELTAVHGNLIALGYLKVDIANRSSGVRYQITTAGKRQLDTAMAIAGEDDVCDDGAEITADGE